MRFGANLSPANVTGALYAEIEVPDFWRDPVSLSGVLMETDIGNAGPLDALKDVAPVVPTAKRTFTERDAPQAFVRVYQGGRDALAGASIRVTIHDRRDEMIFNNRFPLQVGKFDAKTRAADFRFRIPMQALSAGPQLLTFEARVGQSIATRRVRFIVN